MFTIIIIIIIINFYSAIMPWLQRRYDGWPATSWAIESTYWRLDLLIEYSLMGEVS